MTLRDMIPVPLLWAPWDGLVAPMVEVMLLNMRRNSGRRGGMEVRMMIAHCSVFSQMSTGPSSSVKVGQHEAFSKMQLDLHIGSVDFKR